MKQHIFTVRTYIAWEMNAGNSHDWSWDWTEHVDITIPLR